MIRCLEILGEATKRLSPEFRRLQPDLPWRAMAGMRDVLIHAYDQVDLEEVWMAFQRFAEIRRQIHAILIQGCGRQPQREIPAAWLPVLAVAV